MKSCLGASVRMAVIAIVALSGLSVVSPASAAQKAAGPSVVNARPTLADVTPMGVGVGSWVTVPRTLFQCPFTFCNQGQALPGNDLANVCYHWEGGQYWDLVYNRANGHTGFIQESNLAATSPISDQSCNTVGRGTPVQDSYMYQCPDSFCNRGNASFGQDVAAICALYVSRYNYWVWMFNHTNKHEGFVWWTGVQNGEGLPRC